MSLLNLYYITSWTTTVTYLLAVVVLIYKKALFKPPYLYLGCYLILQFSLEIIFWIISWTDLVLYFDKNTLFSYYLYTLNSIILLSFFFNTVFNSNYKIYFFWGAVILISALVIDGVFLSTFKKINSYSSVLFYLYILLTLIFAMERLVKNRKHLSIRREPNFWIYLGLILSHTANTIHNTTANSFINYSANSYESMVCFVYLINILSNLLYAKGCKEIS